MNLLCSQTCCMTRWPLSYSVSIICSQDIHICRLFFYFPNWTCLQECCTATSLRGCGGCGGFGQCSGDTAVESAETIWALARSAILSHPPERSIRVCKKPGKLHTTSSCVHICHAIDRQNSSKLEHAAFISATLSISFDDRDF